MLEYHDPTWLVTRAWSVFRLPVLQDLIEIIIADLQRLEQGEGSSSFDVALSGSAVAGSISAGGISAGGISAGGIGAGGVRAGAPAQEALRACIAELRDASGMAEATARRVAHCEQVRSFMAREPAEWSERFGVALDEYRHRVSFALQTSFAASQLSRSA